MGTIGSRVRELRKAKKLTQPQLAGEIGIDQSTLSDIERGAGFSAEILMRLSDALGASAEMLMRGNDPLAWPFPKVPLARYLALSDEDKGYVQGKLEQAIETCDQDAEIATEYEKIVAPKPRVKRTHVARKGGNG